MFARSLKDSPSLSIHYTDQLCSQKISSTLSALVSELNTRQCDKIILCIGTDRSTGDCLGPLVGTRLKSYRHNGFDIYGTLNEPIHAVNLVKTLEEIENRHKNPFIVAVDACLGGPERVGYINVRPGAIHPGTALKKSLPPVGDVHISGIVNVGGFMEHVVLQNTRLNLVFEMANSIAKGLLYC
ncbi:MAG: spore protease YyaC [Candidatus Saccharibacteria bacterium]